MNKAKEILDVFCNFREVLFQVAGDIANGDISQIQFSTVSEKLEKCTADIEQSGGSHSSIRKANDVLDDIHAILAFDKVKAIIG